ncbi:MAG TPA: RecX family transcriptional regulator [Bacilli bacterium]|nr:RecX family transcriptional regulator [Bacilli bacterium]
MIISYKKVSNNKYKVILDNEELILYDDIIIKYNLLTKKALDKKELEEVKSANDEYFYYDQTLKFISKKLRSEFEVNKYLLKYNISNKVINNIIKKLKDNNIINDVIFTESYVHDKILLSNDGPYKIINDLEKLNVDKDIIDNKIKYYAKELELDKIKKYVSKNIQANKNKSRELLKQKILHNLIMQGYTKEYIDDILENFNIDDKGIYEKEYQKEYNKLSKKYSGNELEYKIKNKMYEKGFRQ